MSRANPDALDMVVRHDRKLRRLPRHHAASVTVGPWYDLSSHLSTGAPGPEVVPQTEGFAVRRWDAPDGAAWGEFRGAILYLTDDDTNGGILDTATPAEYRPAGLRDVWCGIDGDNTPTDFYPVEGGYSYNVTAAGFIVVDASRVLVNLSASPPVLQAPAVGNRQGYPGDSTVTIWNGVVYPITDL